MALTTCTGGRAVTGAVGANVVMVGCAVGAGVVVGCAVGAGVVVGVVVVGVVVVAVVVVAVVVVAVVVVGDVVVGCAVGAGAAVAGAVGAVAVVVGAVGVAPAVAETARAAGTPNAAGGIAAGDGSGAVSPSRWLLTVAAASRDGCCAVACSGPPGLTETVPDVAVPAGPVPLPGAWATVIRP
jgi:hypothetical protein